MILSIIVIVSADVENTNVVCPHSHIMEHTTFVFSDFVENRFCGHSTFVLLTTEIMYEVNYSSPMS